MQQGFLKRTWAEIDYGAAAHNFGVIRRAVPDTAKIMCVVKADAYGHGAAAISAVFDREGADWFGVSNLAEAVFLRETGIVKPILIFGYTPAECAGTLYEHGISQAVFSPEYAVSLSDAAKTLGVTVKIHIKIDTGMSRIGFFFQHPECDFSSLPLIREAVSLPGFFPEGMFTHFSVSDEGIAGKARTPEQFSCFTQVIEQLKAHGLTFPLRHCCNSGGVIDYPGMSLDMVRPGIILYGLHPSPVTVNKLPLQPVMSLYSIISQVKEIPAGTAVSYGETFRAESNKRVATIPIGYADGYARCLGGKACVLVDRKRAPVIGRICMDQLVLDVTHIPSARQGMTVTLFGTDGENTITVDEISSLSGTINYETVCCIGKRVPRTGA